jgi:mRNA interferase MazF
MDFKEVAQKFIDWTKKKVRHHIEEDVDKYFREKEVWWAAMGKNIGYEIDGKNDLFERPVLILKGYSRDMCFVLPLTSKIKNPTPWYQHVVALENGDSAVIISQGKVLSSKRLLRKHDVIDTEDYNAIVEKFINQFEKK